MGAVFQGPNAPPRAHYTLRLRRALPAVVCLLVLCALAVSPVSYVAPARELSILLGVLLGSRLLAERDTRRRMAGAGVMLAGIAGLAVA